LGAICSYFLVKEKANLFTDWLFTESVIDYPK